MTSDLLSSDDGREASPRPGRSRPGGEQPAPADEATAVARTWPGRVRAGLVAAPDRVALVFFWLCLVVAVTVLLGVFHPWLVLPVAVVLVAATWRLGPARYAVSRTSWGASLAALVLGLVWFAVNVPYLSQYVVVTRDPGFLTLEGFWLTHHASPDLPVDATTLAANALPGVQAYQQAYDLAGGVLHVQGAKLVPGLLATLGWALGERGVLVGSLVIGLLALWAVYGFARRVVGPVWALVPFVTLAASVPFAAFTRSAYTEPTTVVLVFGGLTVAWSALMTRSAARLGLAGAMVGAAALARVDSTAQVIGLVAALGLAAACAWDLTGTRWLLTGFRRATALGVLGVLVGLADLAWRSPEYLREHASQTGQLDAALVVVVGAALLVTGRPRPRRALRRLVLLHRRRLAAAAAGAVALVALVLVSRPLWLVERHSPPGSGVATSVGRWQVAEGAALDPTRTYDEHSVTWLSWYFGWPLVILGLAGLALLAHRTVARRDARALVLLGVVGAPSALYLWQVSITPDQIWAMRRFLPVTIPGLLVAATVVLVAVWQSRSRWWRAASVAVAAVVVVWPTLTWGSLFTVREQYGHLDEAHAICRAVDGRPVVLVEPPPGYLAAVRTICDVPTVASTDGSPTTLAAVRRTFGTDVAAVAFRAGAVVWSGPDVTAPLPTRTTVITGWEQRLLFRPQVGTRTVSEVWVGSVGTDGAVTPGRPEGATMVTGG